MFVNLSFQIDNGLIYLVQYKKVVSSSLVRSEEIEYS